MILWLQTEGRPFENTTAVTSTGGGGVNGEVETSSSKYAQVG